VRRNCQVASIDRYIDGISRGKLIRKLNVESFGDNKIAQWNKKDSNSNEVSGGFYIYQVKIKNRTFQGSIIIAR